MGTGKDLWNRYETLVNKHDWDGLTALFARDGVYGGPGWRVDGTEAIRAFFVGYDRTFPDQTMQTLLLVEDGDIVVAEWTFRGTQTGLMPLPDGTEIAATGKTVEFTAVTVAEVRDGEFAAIREYFDTADSMTQLGLMPGS